MVSFQGYEKDTDANKYLVSLCDKLFITEHMYQQTLVIASIL